MSRVDLIKTFGAEDVPTFNKCSTAYEMGRADERKKILDILYKLVKSDYNTNECKLMILDLQEFMWEGEQKDDSITVN